MISAGFADSRGLVLVAPFFKLVNPDINVEGFLKWASESIESGEAALIIAIDKGGVVVGYTIVSAPSITNPECAFINHTFSRAKGSVEAMSPLVNAIASYWQATRLVFQTKRNPKVVERKYGFKVESVVMTKEVSCG